MEDSIARIQRMELYFNTLQNALNINPQLLKNDPLLQEMLQVLLHYYEDGQWLKDYESDERGEFPPSLKRGVLSQDGIYNFLEQYTSEYDDKMSTK